MPLLGAIGNASEYSFRGTYDNYPFDIDFGDLIDAEPGQTYTTLLKLVEDINYKVPISITGDGEYYIGNVSFDKTFDNNYITFDQTVTTFDSTFPELDYSTQPTYVRNGNTIGLRIFGVPPITLSDTLTIVPRGAVLFYEYYNINLNNQIEIDLRSSSNYTFDPNGSVQIDGRTFQGSEIGTEYYDKTYSTTITIGKRDFTWTVKTKAAESAQNLSFTNQSDVEYSTEIISNTYTAQGLTDTFDYTADITSNEGLLSVNYGEFVKSTTVKNGNILRLKLTSSDLNASQKNVALRIALAEDSTVGSATTTWSVTTLDSVPSNLSFTDIPSAELNSQVLSDIITIAGLSDGIDFDISITSTDGLLSVNSSIFPVFEFKVDDGIQSTTISNEFDLTQYNFRSGINYTLVCNKDITVNIKLIGGGGGGVSGGSGGYAEGIFTFIKDQIYKLVVGTAGSKNGTSDISGGGASAGTGGNSGGGYTGLFVNSISYDNAIIIAGGGGGAAENDYRPGGYGGGLEGQSTAAGGGTQTSGGLGYAADSDSGSKLKGGDSRHLVENGGGGGGSGYWGGGAARGDTNFSPGPYGGGGGSGYINQNLIQNGFFKVNLDQYTISGGKNNNKEDGTFQISTISPFVKSTTIRNGNQLQLRLDTSSNWLEEKTVVVKLENTSATWKVTNRTIRANSDANADKLIYSIPFNTINQVQDMSPEVREKSLLSAGLRASSLITTVAGRSQPSISIDQSKYYGDIGSLKLAKGTTTKQFETTIVRINTDSTQSLGFSDFTVEMWMRFSALGFGGEVGASVFYPSYIDSRNINDYFFQLFIKGDNWPNSSGFKRGLLLGYPDANGVVQTICETTYQVLAANTWNHIALTRSGNTFRIWVNGSNVTSGSRSMDLTSTGYNFAIPNSQRLIADDVHFQDLRLYKGVAKYTSNFNPNIVVNSIMEQYTP